MAFKGKFSKRTSTISTTFVITFVTNLWQSRCYLFVNLIQGLYQWRNVRHTVLWFVIYQTLVKLSLPIHDSHEIMKGRYLQIYLIELRFELCSVFMYQVSSRRWLEKLLYCLYQTVDTTNNPIHTDSKHTSNKLILKLKCMCIL